MPKTDKTTAITGDSVYKMAKAYAKKAGEQHVGDEHAPRLSRVGFRREELAQCRKTLGSKLQIV